MVGGCCCCCCCRWCSKCTSGLQLQLWNIRLAAAAGANKMGDESAIPLRGCRWRLWMAICLRFNALQQWRRRQQRDPLSCTMASWRSLPSYTSLVPAALVLPSIVRVTLQRLQLVNWRQVSGSSWLQQVCWDLKILGWKMWPDDRAWWVSALTIYA
jgi:hypothetical protein